LFFILYIIYENPEKFNNRIKKKGQGVGKGTGEKCASHLETIGLVTI